VNEPCLLLVVFVGFVGFVLRKVSRGGVLRFGGPGGAFGETVRRIPMLESTLDPRRMKKCADSRLVRIPWAAGWHFACVRWPASEVPVIGDTDPRNA